MMRRAFLPIIALFIAAPAFAADENAAAWLMRHPVTLWDRGMDALSARTSEAAAILAKKHKTDMQGEVVYSFRANRLDIALLAGKPAKGSKLDCETLRQDFLRSFLKLGDPESLGELSENLMRESFSHAGYAEKSRPKTIARDLVAITHVDVAIASVPPQKCGAPLVSWQIPASPAEKQGNP